MSVLIIYGELLTGGVIGIVILHIACVIRRNIKSRKRYTNDKYKVK